MYTYTTITTKLVCYLLGSSQKKIATRRVVLCCVCFEYFMNEIKKIKAPSIDFAQLVGLFLKLLSFIFFILKIQNRYIRTIPSIQKIWLSLKAVNI